MLAACITSLLSCRPKVWTNLLVVSCDTNILPDGRFQWILVVLGSAKGNSYNLSPAELLLLVANLILFRSWLIAVMLSLGGRVPKCSLKSSSNHQMDLDTWSSQLQSSLRGIVCANAGMMTASWLLGTGTGSLFRCLVMYSQSNIYLNLKGG